MTEKPYCLWFKYLEEVGWDSCHRTDTNECGFCPEHCMFPESHKRVERD